MSKKAKVVLDSSPESIRIRDEWKSLSKSSTSHLRSEFQRSHRVCSLSGVPKGDLVSGIMYARHGQKRIRLAFGLVAS